MRSGWGQEIIMDVSASLRVASGWRQDDVMVTSGECSRKVRVASEWRQGMAG